MEISADDLGEIFDAQCIEAILTGVTKFYGEFEFYSALSFDKLEGNVLSFKLDIRNYRGSVLQTVNIDEITLKVEYEGSEIKSVEYIALSQEVVKSIKVSYLGTAFNIDFPADLDEYPEI